MAGKKAAGENTKKVAGNAKKAEAAAQKQAVENQKKAVVEEAEWSKGAKSTAKRDAAADKAAEAARRKAEKDAILKAEEESLPSKPIKTSKGAAPKPKTISKPLDLSGLDDSPSASSATLNASNIDDALDALSLTKANPAEKLEKHPERRFPAAYKAFEERRLPEVKTENPGLRRNQMVELVRKEFERSPENPFNQVHARYDISKEERGDLIEGERRKLEERLTKT